VNRDFDTNSHPGEIILHAFSGSTGISRERPPSTIFKRVFSLPDGNPSTFYQLDITEHNVDLLKVLNEMNPSSKIIYFLSARDIYRKQNR
jgi:hypothetical protein